MIHETIIKEKDFSSDLQRIIGEARFIALSLMAEGNAESMEQDDLMGVGYMILELTKDLRMINHALYGNE